MNISSETTKELDEISDPFRYGKPLAFLLKRKWPLKMRSLVEIIMFFTLAVSGTGYFSFTEREWLGRDKLQKFQGYVSLQYRCQKWI